MVCPLVTACMRADGPYGALPLSDPAEGTPSALRQTRPRDSRANRVTPNPSSPGFMGIEQRRPKGGLPRRAHAARQRRVHERAVTWLLKSEPAPGPGGCHALLAQAAAGH